jgi:hypothetical protein
VTEAVCDFDWITDDLAIGGRCAMDRAEAFAREHGVGAVIDLRAEDRDDPELWSDAGWSSCTCRPPTMRPSIRP